MKKLIIATAITIAMCGCNDQTVDTSTANSRWAAHERGVKTKVVEIEGHKYVLMSGFKRGGGIVHAVSCPCMSK